MKVSIIIPIYSVERYIEQCIESVLNQNYTNIEIVLVDDGSNDKSAEICDLYAEKHSCIKVIHKINGGLSDARNYGIENATGDYVAFLDGDDFFDDSNAVTEIVERLKKTKADVINYSFKKYYDDTGEKKPYFHDLPAMPISLKSKKEQLDYLSYNHLYISSACNKIVRRELLKDNLLFEKGVFSEDVVWSANLLRFAKSMDFICANFYCYRQRRDSISHSINEKKCQDLYNHIKVCLKLSRESKFEEQMALKRYTAYQFCTFFIVQAQAPQFLGKYINDLSKYKTILRYHRGNWKITILSLGCKIIGYVNLCRLIRFIYRFRK